MIQYLRLLRDEVMFPHRRDWLAFALLTLLLAGCRGKPQDEVPEARTQFQIAMREYNDGDYLVSHWEGRVYRVAPTGDIERILDTTVSGANCADFEYVKDERLLVAPTFGDDRLVAYRLAD